MMFLSLIMVSGYDPGALAALLGTRGVSGRRLVAAAVVGADPGLTPRIPLWCRWRLFPVSAPLLLLKEVRRAYANPGTWNTETDRQTAGVIRVSIADG
jgi:hypothetical protein